MPHANLDLAVVGAGAAGVFAAIQAADSNSPLKIAVFEAGSTALAKVLISGGGRCNVTHAEFDPSKLTLAYFRGGKELKGPFTRFQPRDMVDWVQNQGVALKTERDGRMFPVTDKSETIAHLLLNKLKEARVNLKLNSPVSDVRIVPGGFLLKIRDQEILSRNLLLATGGARPGYKIAEKLRHTISPPVPSLFTFQVQDRRLDGLQGISFDGVELNLKVAGKEFSERGSFLITHWGFSGPAILKLSSRAARDLHTNQYSAELSIDFFPQKPLENMFHWLWNTIRKGGTKKIGNLSMVGIAGRYWERIVNRVFNLTDKSCLEVSKSDIRALAAEFKLSKFKILGKGIFKEEFVTCGGVALKEVDFKTMQSKLAPGLFFAGEILNIDGITGGYNFQAAWTTGYLAGRGIANTQSQKINKNFG